MSKQKSIPTLQNERDTAREAWQRLPGSDYLQRNYRKKQAALDKALTAHLANTKTSTPVKQPTQGLIFVVVLSGTDQLKYRIKEGFIRKFGSEEAIRKAKKALATREANSIPLPTIAYHCNLRMNERAVIGDKTLMIYADYLGFNMDYLKADYLYHLSQQKIYT